MAKGEKKPSRRSFETRLTDLERAIEDIKKDVYEYEPASDKKEEETVDLKET